jgi:hypothetical protein
MLLTTIVKAGSGRFPSICTLEWRGIKRRRGRRGIETADWENESLKRAQQSEVGGAMKCDCIQKMNEELRRETGDPEARIVANYVIYRNEVEDFAHIEALYRKKLRNGELARLETKHYVIGSYCPFCGRELQYGRSEG